jgi:hypothetical protein
MFTPTGIEAIIVLPAYGRRYATSREALLDWWDGKDFQIFQGPYVSVRDAQELIAKDYTHVHILSGTGVTLAIVLIEQIPITQ